jgi:hypothetical protein
MTRIERACNDLMEALDRSRRRTIRTTLWTSIIAGVLLLALGVLAWLPLLIYSAKWWLAWL